MGFLKNIKENAANRSVALETLRPDLQRCAKRLVGETQLSFLNRAGSTGFGPQPAIPESESFLAVMPSTRSWDEGDYDYNELGVLYLTSERLFWRTGQGGFELPVHDLTLGGLRTESQRWGEYLHIAVGPGRNPSYKFDMGLRGIGGQLKNAASYEYFLETLKSTVRDAESARKRPGSSGPSAADEIAKFAMLRDQGIISDEEFASKKSQLLG